MKPVIIIENCPADRFELKCEEHMNNGYVMREMHRKSVNNDEGEKILYDAIFTHISANIVLQSGIL